MDEILFESLEYGCYMLDYDDGHYEENVKFAGAEFNKLHLRKVRLPDGKGNIVYLLSDTFDHSLEMITHKNFIPPASYKQVYYPIYQYGVLHGRRFSFNVRSEKQDRDQRIRNVCKLKPWSAKSLTPTTSNIYYITCDLFQAMKKIMEKYSFKRNYEGFYPQLSELLKGSTPEKNEKLKGANDNHRVLIIDAERFCFDINTPLKNNKTNPLYLFYLAFLRTKDMSKLNVDLDMLICAKNLFIKFNPMNMDAKAWPNFRKALFRIMKVNLDAYTDRLSEDEKKEIDLDPKDHTISAVVNDTLAPYDKIASPSTKAVLAAAVEDKIRKKAGEAAQLNAEIKAAQKDVSKQIGLRKKKEDPFVKSLEPPTQSTILGASPAKTPLDTKHEKLYRSLGSYSPLGVTTGKLIEDDDEEDFDQPPEDSDPNIEEIEDEIASDVSEVLSDDKEIVSEVLDVVQDNIAPMNDVKTAPVNSARDRKLREEQKKIVVKNSTIEEVLKRESDHAPLQTQDKSKVMHTSNENMKKITFAYADKTYLDELYVKHLVACFDMLKDKNSPFYITGIDIRDTSTNLEYKETWTVHLTDENKKRHTIRVDIPKFINDRFMWINGTKWIILRQNFYNPLVKDTPDTVILTTNFNKITIRRKSSKSLATVEKIFSLIKKTGDKKVFITGDSSSGNLHYISSLEYDELSRRLFKFSSNGCELCFSREYIKENMSDQIPADIKGKEFFIGTEHKHPILINEDTGLDRQGRTIAEIIEQNLSDQYRAIYASTKAPSQSMYVEGKLAGQFIPIVVTLIVWEGLTKTLQRMKIQWKFDPTARRVPKDTNNKKYIRFANGLLEYESQTFAELILNGLAKLHPEKFQFEDFNSEVCYNDYIYSVWGNYTGINQLRNFYEFLIDPITKNVCRDYFFPDDPAGLLIHAVKLLCDNVFVSKANDKSYRTRSIEMIPAILYSCIAQQYNAYVKSGRRIPMTLNQRCVITKLIAEKTVEAYSTLNPVIEVSKTHTISTKGYKGSNSDHSYDEQKRSYDPTSVGKIAISTSADANVGINKSLVVEPTIANASGYREPVEDVETLKDVNVFSPVELLTPGTARNDDPIRTAIATKQSQHVVPVADAAPALVSNGFDEAVQFHLSDDFVINADEDGKVIDVNEDLGFIVVQYKSGKTKAISTNPEVVKNSGGGFYMSNQLTPTVTKVGQSFKKDEPLAYHPKYFRHSKLNGLRYAIGPVVKMAVMSSYNTYEDAGICTEKLAERMKTSLVYLEEGKFKRNNNILYMVKVGDHVNIGDPLIRFDLASEEDELSKYLSRLDASNAQMLEEETKNEIKTMHAGKVIDIKVYTLLDPSHLSPTLGNVVQKYFDRGNDKKKFLTQYDSSDGFMKAGYMLTDSTEPVRSRYNSIKGNKGIDVLIEIYIEHDDVMGVGDKVALYGPNKQIISEVIPKGYEPYSEFRPDEEISVMTSPGTIARRMTPGVLPVSAAMKCMIELKRKIQKEIKYK